MNFRTVLAVPAASWSFGLADPLLTLGSCFASTIGERLVDNKFKAMVNPFGATYHPKAIHKHLQLALLRQDPSDEGYIHREGRWFHHDFHSALSAPSRDDLAALLSRRLAQVAHFLQDARVLILTYGTSWLYETAHGQRAVANCHKLPASRFTRRLTEPTEIISGFQEVSQLLRHTNPGLRTILTVSPVRHTRDTLPLNQVSKAALRLACHQLQLSEASVDYFPSYELMMDDLRDYRFYGDDLVHPTPFAENYIWTSFTQAFCHPNALDFMKQWESVRQSLTHRPFDLYGEAHRKFLVSLYEKVKGLQAHADVSTDMQFIEQQLALIKEK